MQCTRIKYFFSSLAGTLLCLACIAQPANYDRWKTLFNKPFDGEKTATESLWDSINSLPLREIKQIVTALENDKSIRNSEAGQAKMAILKIRFCRKNIGYYDNQPWVYWGNQALKFCALSEDDYLLQSTCNILGDIHLKDNKIDTAVFYLIKGVTLAEQLGYKKETLTAEKIAASNALYHTQNYIQCIQFCSSDINLEEKFIPITAVTAYNNTGLSYLKLNRPDSAIYFFTKAANFCHRIKWGVWEGITSGNIGDALHAQGKDAEAMPYWQKDYDSCMKYGELKNAGLTLSFMSQYQFNTGQREKVTGQLHWAAAINADDALNLLRINKIQAYCYRKLGLHDSADFFLQRHYYLADSINRVISQNNFNTVQVKLAYEKNTQEFKLLKKERQAEVIRRNLLLVALISLGLIGLLLYNRQRLKIKLVQQQQAIAEAEKDSAKEQLLIFTQTLLEKNEQIEKLSASLQHQTVVTNDELIHQTLLTDYDWNRFKELFEKIHPGFFTSLKNAAAGVTQSEMRLAALIKLNLDNKQMASMQGISVSSLRGNKTRLRQKLNISAETELEEVIKQL